MIRSLTLSMLFYNILNTAIVSLKDIYFTEILKLFLIKQPKNTEAIK
jgi:hypothetical protein